MEFAGVGGFKGEKERMRSKYDLISHVNFSQLGRTEVPSSVQGVKKTSALQYLEGKHMFAVKTKWDPSRFFEKPGH